MLGAKDLHILSSGCRHCHLQLSLIHARILFAVPPKFHNFWICHFSAPDTISRLFIWNCCYH